MGGLVIFLFCSFSVLFVQCEVTLEADRPSINVEVSHRVVLECCFTTSRDEYLVWVKSSQLSNKKMETLFFQDGELERKSSGEEIQCGMLILKQATLDDTGFYCCYLNVSKVFTHGTYLQVYRPLAKTLKLSESVKNGILTAEGILLLLCVILPSAILLVKFKNLNEMEKRKVKREEENIYQGLNLDDCFVPYDQIDCTRVTGPYEDVDNNKEDIQLEKP